MAMTDEETKALRNYCAFLLKEYGFQFNANDPVIPALYIIHREMLRNNQRNEALSNQVKEATAKLKSKSFNFNVPGESWKYQAGIALKWFVLSSCACVVAALAMWRWSISDEVARAREIINRANLLEAFLLRMHVDKKGFYYLDFKEAGRDSVALRSEYEKISSKTVRVYLGRSPK